jgi:hypothetical protein
MPDTRPAAKAADDVVAVEVAGNMAHRAMRMEILAIEGRDASGFLTAVLEGVQAERNEARRIVGTPDSEDAALFAQLVVVEWIGRQRHVGPEPPGGHARVI